MTLAHLPSDGHALCPPLPCQPIRFARSSARLKRMTGPKKPNVYLAGKIRKHCWRHRLVSGLREHSWSDGALPQDDFVYVGPFFVGCDHGCFHNKNAHGAVAIRGINACKGRDAQADFDCPHLELVNLCLDAVTRADLLFCYIDSKDCFGTLVEIGYAIAHNVPVVIAFALGVALAEDNDFWFVSAKARWVVYGVTEQDLPSHLLAAIRRYS